MEDNTLRTVAVRYLKAQDISFAMRAKENLPGTGFIKMTIKIGPRQYIRELKPVEDPAKDILACLAGLKPSFNDLELGSLQDIHG